MSEIETLLENLSPKQEEILKEFRETVQDVIQPQHDDFFLLKWLKARNFDIEKSGQMLKKSLEWRKNYGTDTILKWEPPEVLKKYWPGGMFGFDKQGHPILWQINDKFDVTGMLKSAKRSDIIRYHIWRMEKLSRLCEEQSAKLGRRIACAVHVSDLTGFNLKMAFTPGIPAIMKEVFAITEANYPENLYASYVINAPSTFVFFFNILRPFLSEATKRKVHIWGRNWKERLHSEVADLDQVPAFWGGNARYPDDLCTDYINACVPIPSKYYIQDKLTLNKDTMSKVTVQRGGIVQLPYDVTSPGTLIRWVFETEHYDIAYGIFFKPQTGDTVNTGKNKASSSKDSSLEEIKQVSRVNSQLVPEDGNITCTKAGTYIFQFDNSYSWVHNKHVFYDVEILPPLSDPVVFKNVSINEEQIEESTYL